MPSNIILLPVVSDLCMNDLVSFIYGDKIGTSLAKIVPFERNNLCLTAAPVPLPVELILFLRPLFCSCCLCAFVIITAYGSIHSLFGVTFASLISDNKISTSMYEPEAKILVIVGCRHAVGNCLKIYTLPDSSSEALPQTDKS